ncbi:hypothetical protein MFLAVUS_001242 [Mucor flavus]|uniref:Uncharacterized protein n=1 Tax=Mucor flavus TaxID=439312 RepID=A0ABP9YLX3_9FUNG
MQPDFAVNKLIHSHYHGPSVVGDIKGENRKEDTHDCLVDLIRIGMISGSSINQNKYDGVVGVHIVGLQLTFYITTLMANGIYIMLEICSVTLPRDFTEMRSYVAIMEDLLPVIHYYDRCTECSDDEWLELNKKDMLNESLFLSMINCGKTVVVLK